MINIISKLEENEALDYIRRKLIPEAMLSWNNGLAYSIHGQYHLKVDEKMMLRNLKKRFHIFNYDKSVDYIEYDCYIENPKNKNFNASFQFKIAKDSDGEIIIKWSHSHSMGQEIVFRKPDLKFQKSDLKEVNGYTDFKGNEPLTKIDEGFAVDYIYKILIPFIIDNIYNEMFSKVTQRNLHNKRFDINLYFPTNLYPRIGYNTLRKHLKKINQDEYLIVYTCRITSEVWFTFYLRKLEGNRLQIMLNHSISTSKNNICFNVLPHGEIRSNPINEIEDRPNSHDLTINPNEEREALGIIIKHLIPTFVKDTNYQVDYDKKHGWNNTMWDGKKLEPLTDREVIVGMKKVKNEPSFKIFKFEKGASEKYFGIIKNWQPFLNNETQITLSVGSRAGGRLHSTWNDKKQMWVDDLDSGWTWRSYNPIEKKWDVYLEEQINEMKRPINVKFPLSKEDELRALDYIRKEIIPIFVNYHNSINEKTVDVRGIDRNLKKFVQKITPSGGGMEYVVWRSPTPVKDWFFTFQVYHTHNGTLKVSWGYEDNVGVGYAVDSSSVGEKVIMKPIGENRYKETPPDYSISKQDEGRALDYIYKVLIRIAVNSWNAKSSSPIKEEDVRRSLKKVEHKIWNEPRFHDYIKYKAPLPLKVVKSTLDFTIWKDEYGELMAGWQHPFVSSIRCYYVGDKELNEAIDTNKFALSKLDEDKAVDFIRRVLIPEILNFYNETTIYYGAGKPQKVIDVIRTLKKINEYGNRDGITYQAFFYGEPYEFNIFKDHKGQLRVHKRGDGTNVSVK